MFNVNADPRLSVANGGSGLDTDRDGRIVSSGNPNKFGDFGPKGTLSRYVRVAENTWAIYRPGTETAPAEWTPPVATPDPVTPPPTPAPVPAGFVVVVSGADRYVANDHTTVGLNDGGCLGAFVKPVASPLLTFGGGLGLRAAWLDHAKQFEVIGHGRWIEGFFVGGDVDGKRIVAGNVPLSGYAAIKGRFGAGADWTGKTPFGLSIDQRFALVDRASRFEVTLTNATDRPMHNLRYMRSVDFDMDDDSVPNRDVDAFPTNNSIPTFGTAVCGFRGVGKGLFGYLHTDDRRARASIFGFVNTDPFVQAAYDTAKVVSTAKAGDLTANLCWHIGTLLPGESTTIVWDLGLTTDPKTIGG